MEESNFKKLIVWQKGEVASQLYHAKDLGYVDDETFERLQNQLGLISAMLYNLLGAIKRSPVRGERYK